MAAPATSQYAKDFSGPVTAQTLRTAEDRWQENLKGPNKLIYEGAKWLKRADDAIALIAAPLDGFVAPAVVEGAVHVFASAAMGHARTEAENESKRSIGGTEKDMGGLGRKIWNTAKEILPS